MKCHISTIVNITYIKCKLIIYKKIYNSDVALNSLKCQNNRYDLTHNLENIIFNELPLANNLFEFPKRFILPVLTLQNYGAGGKGFALL